MGSRCSYHIHSLYVSTHPCRRLHQLYQPWLVHVRPTELNAIILSVCPLHDLAIVHGPTTIPRHRTKKNRRWTREKVINTRRHSFFHLQCQAMGIRHPTFRQLQTKRHPKLLDFVHLTQYRNQALWHPAESPLGEYNDDLGKFWGCDGGKKRFDCMNVSP